jgi:superfamily I DNA/RNA helicase
MMEDRQFDFVSIINTAAQFLKSRGKGVERTIDYRAWAKRNNFTWADELKLLVDADHVIVDEAQDLDRSQMDIVLALADNGMTVDIVGDDDQSIYRFRGGLGYEGMKEFMEKTGAVEIKFEKNFRSRPEILHLAQCVIDVNIHRIPKTLNPFHARGYEVISIDNWKYAETEVDFIVRNIAGRLGANRPNNADAKLDVAILARQRRQLDYYELSFKALGIAHYRAPKESIWLKMPLAGMLAFLKDPFSLQSKGGTRQLLEWAAINSDRVDLRSLEKVESENLEEMTQVENLGFIRKHIASLNSSSTNDEISEIVGHLYKWLLRAIEINGVRMKWKKSVQEANRSFAMWGIEIEFHDGKLMATPSTQH